MIFLNLVIILIYKELIFNLCFINCILGSIPLSNTNFFLLPLSNVLVKRLNLTDL